MTQTKPRVFDTPSRWPISPDDAERLRRFMGSPMFGRLGDVSEFWAQLGPQHQVELRDGTAIVRSGFAIDGPGQRARRIPIPAPLLWRARLHELARRRELQDQAARTASAFIPGAIGRDLAEVPEYRVLLRSHDGSRIPLYRAAAYLNSMIPYVPEGARAMLEIGGGLGLLAIGAHRLLCLETVTLVDLPPMVAVAFVALRALEIDVALPNEEGKSSPFRLLTNAQTSAIADSSIDLAVNTGSFQEMTAPVISGYFDLLKRVCRPGAVFYCANEAFSHRVEDAVFDEYPWPETWTTVRDGWFNRDVPGDVLRERISVIG